MPDVSVGIASCGMNALANVALAVDAHLKGQEDIRAERGVKD